MLDVAPGRTVADRFVLNERRLSAADGSEVWSAADAEGSTEVLLTLLNPDAPTTPAVLDAARRASHVRDPRLVRILDIGSSSEVAWIAEEHLPGARTLVDVVEDNPLTGEQTRTMLGEAASALAAGGRRGTHHLRLTPYSVLVTPDGAVKVSGLGTLLALDGEGEPDRERAERLDALGLLGVAYYAMTTRWPLPKEVPGVPPAPSVVGGVPAPSEIAAGVPADLDLLCRNALSGQGCPAGPEQLAAEIAPWRPRLDAGSGDAPAPIAAPTVVLPVVASPAETPAEAPAKPTPAAAAATPDRVAEAARPPSAVAAAGEAAGRLGSFARAAADKAQLKREELAARRAAERDAQVPARAVHLSDLPDDTETADGRGDPLWPFDTEERAGSHSRFVLASIAVVCVVAFVLAGTVVVRGLKGEAPAAAPGTPAARPSTSTSAPVAPPTPVAIASGRSVDPLGDGSENDDQIPRAYDGDPATRWASEQYYSDPGWGGAANAGVGLAFKLTQPSALKQVSLTFGTIGQTGSVYVGPSPELSGATKVGSFAGATGTQEIALTGAPEQPYVIVWFTKAPRDGGSYRVSLNEIVPRG